MNYLPALAVIALLLLAGCTANPPANAGNQTASIAPTQQQIIISPTKTGENMAVEKGDIVSVWYLGTLEDGSVFDTNIVEEAKKAKTYNSARPYTTLKFVVGTGQMIKGFDDGVLGMKEKETKTVKIPAKEAYGEVNPALLRVYPLAELEKNNIEAKIGVQISNGASQGVITAINGSNVTIDFNHFLAGKALIFKITVDSIEKNK
ncbi:MAG: peptidylprolyl isomerase [Candidatus Micrarchaeota archaeon]